MSPRGAVSKPVRKMLPPSAWPITSRPIIRGPRPQLEQERRDAIADMDTIIKAEPGKRCMRIVGYAAVASEEVWKVRQWSGMNPSAVYCGARAEVNIGCNYCVPCGASALTKRILIQLRDATQKWDPFEEPPRGPLAEQWDADTGMRIRWGAECDGGGSAFGADILELGRAVALPLWGIAPADPSKGGSR